MERFSMSVQYVKGVGPKRFYKLKRLNIKTLYDLIYFFPRDYEDRTKFMKLREAPVGEKVSLEVEITGLPAILKPRKNMSILKIPFRDDSGIGNLVWFNQDYLKDKFFIGERLVVNGKVNRMGSELQIVNPVFEKGNMKDKVGRILPVYPLTEGLTNNEIIKIIGNVLRENIDYLEENLPYELREKYKLMGIKEAIRGIHFPRSKREVTEARRRIAFEELLTLQLGLFAIKNKSYIENKGIEFPKIDEVKDFIDSLPFKLTNAQKRF